MKLFYFSVPIIFLLFIGCSSTYRVTDYPSKEKYHESVNSFIKYTDVNVITADSSLTAKEGSKIKNDTLDVIKSIQEKKEQISLRDIKEIKYFGKAYEEPSAFIWLKNGKEIKRDKIKILPDSSIQFRNIQITSEYIPIDNVKEIRYHNRGIGAVIYALIGSGSGFILGAISGATGIYPHVNDGGNEPLTFDSGTSMILGAFGGVVIGAVTGAIIGYIVGFDRVYQFNY